MTTTTSAGISPAVPIRRNPLHHPLAPGGNPVRALTGGAALPSSPPPAPAAFRRGDPAPAIPGPSSAAARRLPRRSARVLIADDSPAIRDSLAKLLRAEGYIVELAAGGGEALELFDPQSTDLVLLDLDMPVTNGWEALERLMTLDPQLAVIIMTGKFEPCQWTGAGQAGILMEKPVHVGALLESIRDALSESAADRQERIALLHRMMRHTRPLAESFRWHSHPEGGLNE